MADCLIAFGSNEGDPAGNYRLAVELLDATANIEVQSAGEPVVTQPVGGPADQPVFLNAAIRLDSELSAAALHERLIAIEQQLGRERHARWGPRSVDLDLLLYDQQIIQTDKLTVPHARMSFRRFVLEPASQIAGVMQHPVSGRTIDQLLAHLDQRDNVVVSVGADVELLKTLSAASKADDWVFLSAASVDAYFKIEGQAKLVIVFPDSQIDRDLKRHAMAFAGPMLDLTNSTEVQAEVVAALQAAK